MLKTRILLVLCALLAAGAGHTLPAALAFTTPLALDNLDPAAFTEWVDGQERPVALRDGPRHVIWTQTSAPEWDGLRFADSKASGARYLRIGWKTALPVGTILVRAGGQVSVLRATAAYPGNMADEAQWVPATRLRGRAITRDEAGQEDYCLWTLPPGTTTRALRFTHTAMPTDRIYGGWLGGAFVLADRIANIAPQAVAATSANDETSAKINNESNDGTWGAWENGKEGGAEIVSPQNAPWAMLTWTKPVRLSGLCAVWAGFSAAEAQAYIGPADKHPREAPDSDWQTIRAFDGIENQYPRSLGPNWLDFGQTITTRAIRLRLTKATQEQHPHLYGKTFGGKRVWLGELMALQPLESADLKTAILPAAPQAIAAHPPIPVRFTLKEAGFVTLVIEDAHGKRVRNLVAETQFPAGENVVWWDGMDDLGRDTEAAHHGIYNAPGQFVVPGTYRVRGLWRKGLDLRYEFSVYNGGNPAWETEDRTGGWLTTHTPPSSALYLPGDRAPGGKPLVYIGSYVAEGGHGLAWVDLNGKKQGGVHWVGGTWTGAPYLARDVGARPDPNTYLYAGAAWEGELRLTAITPQGDRAVVKYPFAGGKDAAALTGLAARDGLLVCSLPKQGQLLFVDASLNRVRAQVPLPDPRGLAFDTEGRLLVLSGTKLLRFTLPYPLAPATRLDHAGWTATASVHGEDAGKALDADANSRWSTNGWQAPGQWFAVDMKSPQAFTTVVLSSAAGQDSPKGYEVYVSQDGQDWGRPIATGAGTPGVTTISFPKATARYLKIVQTGAAQDAYWSINSLEVFDAPPPAEAPVALPETQVVVGAGLEDPQHVALDRAGNLYISDRGTSHQVKVFSGEGQPLRAIGNPGAPKAGPYDRLHMNNPNGLTIDENDHLWVAETDFSPKRVSVWTLDGKLVRAFYGPAQYGGGGTLDPKDKTRFYYTGMEFKLDWKAGTDEPVSIIFRPGPDDLAPPDGWGANGLPETPLYANGRQYMTNCYDSNPTNGSPIAMLWVMRGGIARPVAAVGRANDWSLLKGDAFKPKWPEGIDLKGDMWRNQTLFAWSDLNDDNHVQPDEVTFIKAAGGGFTAMPDLAMVASRVDDKAMRFAPQRFTPGGAPVYDLSAGQTLVAGVQAPTTSGGDQALVSGDGWTILTVAPKPFGAASMGGVYKGVPMWSYPSLWPGLHASHESAPPDHPGELIGTTRLLGGFISPRGSERDSGVGPLWCVNGNQGNMYLFTEDGLFVAQLFQDVRCGRLWSMPVAQRNILLNDITLHDENFWPSITQTADGNVYLVDGARTSLVRVDGLDSLRRLPATTLPVTAAMLKGAQGYFMQTEAQRQKTRGQSTLKVALREHAPVVDGKLDDWANAEWVTVDKRGVAAYFDSNSKPYDVAAAVEVAGDRLYAAFCTGDRDLLRNSGEVANAPFKSGGALDLMIGANASADANRREPVAGDERLLVTIVKGKPLALLYRAVVPGTKEPVPFSSPWRTIKIDRVDDLSDQVTLAGADGNYELSVPLAALGLTPTPGLALKGDIGILRGNGFQTMQRVYWSNKATGITADVPSEAELTPQLWGRWEFVAGQ